MDSDRSAHQAPPPLTFDVVVPAFNEASHISECLDLILAQDYRAELVRVWVVDAGSTDATAQMVRARSGPRLTLVEGLGRLNAAQAMNAGITRGSAELIARVDAHTHLAPDYLSQAAALFAAHDERLACAGGQPEQVGETLFGQAVALARRSRFGVGNSVYADVRAHAYVDTVQAGVYRRSALDAIGGFAENMLVGEDEEINWRLRKAGWLILLDSRLRFRYFTRPTWRAAFRQYRHYGQSRSRVLAAHPEFLRPRHLAPSVFSLGLGALALASLGSPLAQRGLAGLVAAYAAAALCAGIVSVPRGKLFLAPAVAAVFPALHLGYGIGLIKGLMQVARARFGGTLPLAVARR